VPRRCIPRPILVVDMRKPSSTPSATTSGGGLQRRVRPRRPPRSRPLPGAGAALVILDLMLRPSTGSTCAASSGANRDPIIILTPRTPRRTRSRLEMGVTTTSPSLLHGELVTRVRAHLRRASISANPADQATWLRPHPDDTSVTRSTCAARRAAQGVRAAGGFLLRPGRLVRARSCSRGVGSRYVVTPAPSTSRQALRAKIEEDPPPRTRQAVRGLGYKLLSDAGGSSRRSAASRKSERRSNTPR